MKSQAYVGRFVPIFQATLADCLVARMAGFFFEEAALKGRNNAGGRVGISNGNMASRVCRMKDMFWVNTQFLLFVRYFCISKYFLWFNKCLLLANIHKVSPRKMHFKASFISFGTSRISLQNKQNTAKKLSSYNQKSNLKGNLQKISINCLIKRERRRKMDNLCGNWSFYTT